MSSLTSGIINLCIGEAKNSDYRFKIGAVIFKNTRILSSAHNELRYSCILGTKYRAWKNSLHAEQAAILKIKNKDILRGASMLIIKTSKTLGLLSNAKPCEWCIRSLIHFGFKSVYYSNEKGEIVELELYDTPQN